MAEIVLALSTFPVGFDVESMAAELLDLGVAACITVLPHVRSVYKWDGATERSDEQQLLIKTTRERIEPLWIALKAWHPYEVPEFVVVPVLEGNPAYLKWVEDSVHQS